MRWRVGLSSRMSMVSPSTTFSTSAVVAMGSAATVGGEVKVAVATTAAHGDHERGFGVHSGRCLCAPRNPPASPSNCPAPSRNYLKPHRRSEGVFECRKDAVSGGHEPRDCPWDRCSPCFLWEQTYEGREYSRKVPGVAGCGIGPTRSVRSLSTRHAWPACRRDRWEKIEHVRARPSRRGRHRRA